MTWNRRDWLAIAFLVGTAFAFFWPLFVPGPGRHYFVGGDFVDQFYAFAVHETRELAAGRVPLWNPYAYAGAPFWADIQSAVAYPPSLAVVLAGALSLGRLPFLALELEAVAHFALTGSFTYLFARRVLRRRDAALVAALTFAFGGYLMGYPALQLAVLESNAWLPLALLGVELVVTADGRHRRESDLGVVLLAVATGMGVLAGHPQSALYMFYAVAAYFLWRAWPWRETGARPWMRVGLGVGAGVGLSAAGWLPALEFLGLSNRAAISHAVAGHGFPPRELLGAIVPGITQWSPLYVGVLPLVLAAIGAGSVLLHGGVEARRDRVWVVLGLVSLLLSLGAAGALFDVFYLLAPGFDLFRGQERSAVIVSFSLAMLAGSGYRRWDLERRSVGVLVVLGAGSLFGFALATAIVAPIEWHVNALWVVLFAAWSGFAALVAAAGGFRDKRLLLVALLLITLDLYRVNGHTNLARGAPGELQVSPDIATMTMSRIQRVQNDDRLPRNFGVLHGIESTSGASPMRLRWFDELRDALAETRETQMWALLSVSHVLTWRSSLEHPSHNVITVGSGDDSRSLLGLQSPVPMAWLAGEAVHVTDEEAAARLADPGFDLFETVLLHDDGDQMGTGHRSRAGLSGPTRGVGESTAITNAESPGWVVFSEVYYPGWVATVDDVPVTPLRANLALIAVPVPAGDHEVRIRFTSPSVRVGLLLSMLTAIALVVYLGWAVAVRPR